MADFNFDKFNSTLQKDLENLLTKGAPKSQDKLDQQLHTFHVSKTAEKFFKKRAETTLAEITKNLSPNETKALKKLVDDAVKHDAKHEGVIAIGQEYTFQLSCNKPAHRFNKDKLKISLTKRGWPLDQIDALISECMDAGEPAKTFSVLPIRA